MFSSVTSFFLILAGIIMVVTVIGALIWAVIHVSLGKFRVEYKVASSREAAGDNEPGK